MIHLTKLMVMQVLPCQVTVNQRIMGQFILTQNAIINMTQETISVIIGFLQTILSEIAEEK